MMRSTKQTLIRLSEAIAAIGAVLVFFLVFMAVIGLIFPEGKALGALVLSTGRTTPRAAPSRIDLDAIGTESFVAVLSETHRSVKDKPVEAIAWSDARAGMPLVERHSVQTQERSSAVISFGGDDRLSLDENSLVVIRSMTRNPRQRRRLTSIVALEGRLRGRVEAGTSETDDLEVEVVTAAGSARFRSFEREEADFDVRVNPDTTSTFSVYSGIGEVTSAGKTVTLGRNQTVTVSPSQPPGAPVSLPASPTILGPRDGAAVAYRSLPPPVRFEWSGDTAEYRLEIGRGRDLEEIVHDERIEGTEFVHGNLPEGRLYWRVIPLLGWAEGPAAPARSLDLIQDTEAPGLKVSFPEGAVPVRGALLHGITEPGTRVFVADQDVSLEETGAFEHALNLDPGLNLVVVEAIDPAGNVTYRSKLITAEHERSPR